jgi:hypothetical protein
LTITWSFSYVYVKTKIDNLKQTTSSAGHFNGHADVLKQLTQHCPMKQIQGHTRCPFMPSLVNYLLHIAPATARATGKQTTMKKYTYFVGCFEGHGNAPGPSRAHRPME